MSKRKGINHVETHASYDFPRRPRTQDLKANIPGDQPGVRYRTVPGFLLYVIGSDGSVWKRTWKPYETHRRWMRKKLTHDGKGYYHVTIWRGKKGLRVGVHTLVLSAFRGGRPRGKECCHYDGNPSNNCLENLRWDTPEGNRRDLKRHMEEWRRDAPLFHAK